MKKVYKLFMLFLLLFVAQNAWSVVVASGDLTSTITWKVEKLSGVSKLTVSGTGEMPDYTSFTAVPWADLRSTISILEIGDGITNIGNYAFNGIAITKVAIPSSCKKIGMYAFYGCKKMTDIYIPASVVTIGTSAVSNCSKLGFVHYDDRCSSRTALNLSSCAKTGRFIEKSGTGTSYADVPEGWEYYTHGVQCYGGAWVAENADQTKLFFYAQNPGATVNFAVAGRVPSAGIRNNPEYHPWRVQCYKYTSLEINKNVASIDDGEFLGYDNSDVTKIGYTNMKTITVQSGNSYFVVGEDGALYDKAKTKVYLYPAKNTTTEIEIPATVTTIGTGAFYGAKNLKKVTFLGTINDIGGFSFAQASSLNYLHFATETAPDAGITSFRGVASKGTVAAEANTNAFRTFTSQIGSGWTFDGETYGPVKSYISDGTLYVVGKGAYSTASSDADWYSQRSSIKKIVVKDGITNIGGYAFRYCDNVTEATLHNSGYIDYGAFASCEALTRVNIGKGVTAFNENHYEWKGLERILKESCTPFDGCSSLSVINIEDLASYCAITGLEYLVHKSYFYGYETAKEKTFMINGVKHSPTLELVIPEGVTAIPSSAFRDFTNVTKIKFPSSLETIAYENFQYHTYLTEITVPSTVSSVGSKAFYECTSLKTVTLNNKGDIGKSAFLGCTSLQTVTLNNKGYIDDYAFASCTSLQTVTLNNTETIGEAAFKDCSSLTRVNIGGVKGFVSAFSPRYPFYGCSKLETINVMDLASYYSISHLEYLTSSSYGTRSQKTLMINGVAYDSANEFKIAEGVTKIPSGAFCDFTNVTNIRIPSTVTSVGADAFSNSNLKTIVCVTPTCPEAEDRVAKNGGITLKVRHGLTSLYKASKGWQGFNIVEFRYDVQEVNMYAYEGKDLYTDVKALSWTSSDTDVATVNKRNDVSGRVITKNFVYDGTTSIPYKTVTITTDLGDYDTCVWKIRVYPREIELVDGNEYKLTEDIDAEKISYTRTYAEKYKNHLQCFYVPFDVEVTDELLEGYTFYELYMVSQKDTNGNGEIEDNEPLVMVLSKIPAGDVIQANMPYYIKPKGATTLTVTAENATLHAAAQGIVSCSTTKYEYTLTGIYETTNIKGNYTMAANGTFKHFSGDTNLGSYRWYMTARNRRAEGAEYENYARPVEIVIDGEDDVTGIVALQDKSSASKIDKIYTLDGRQVTDYDNLPSGIYIINGKKVFKK